MLQLFAPTAIYKQLINEKIDRKKPITQPLLINACPPLESMCNIQLLYTGNSVCSTVFQGKPYIKDNY